MFSLIQLAADLLVTMFKPVTMLGDEYETLIILATLYWVFDHKIAIRVAVAFLFSVWLNNLLKLIIQEPRPPVDTHEVEATGYGMPSGHAQNTMSLWGLFSLESKHNKFLLLAGPLIALLVGISRVILNVHTWEQVLVGWTIGIIIAFSLYYGAKELQPLMEDKPSYLPYVLISAATAVMIIVGALMSDSDDTLETIIKGASAFFGMFAGYLRLKNCTVTANFGRPQDWMGYLIRIVIGIVLTLVALLGLKLVLDFLGSTGIAIRYIIVGFTVAFVAPWCFEKLPLAESKPIEASPVSKQTKAEA